MKVRDKLIRQTYQTQFQTKIAALSSLFAFYFTDGMKNTFENSGG